MKFNKYNYGGNINIVKAPLKMFQSLALLCANSHKQRSLHAPACEAALQPYMLKTGMLLQHSAGEIEYI